MNQIPQEVKDALRQPLPPESIKPHPTKTYMSTIKAIYMVERLNNVFGENGWEDEYEIIENRPESKMVVVRGTIRIPEHGIKRTAFGGNDNPDRGDAYKGACTDALSKMCSMLGIGMDVYKGMNDHPEPDSPEGKKLRAAAKKDAKRQYEAVSGVVTQLTRTSPANLWLQINGVAFRALDIKHINALKESQGKRVEIRAFWDFVDKGKKKPVMTVDQVMGVYELTPGKVEGVPLDFDSTEAEAYGEKR